MPRSKPSKKPQPDLGPVRRRRKAFIATPDAFVQLFAQRFPGVFLPETHRAVFALRAVAQLVNDYSNEWLAAYGLTVGKYNYLVQLYAARDKRLSLNELGRYIHTTNGTVTTMINALEKDGLVKRVPSELDGRSMLAEITPRGISAIVSAVKGHHLNLEAGFDAISESDRRKLSQLLARVAAGFESKFGIAIEGRSSDAEAEDTSWIAKPGAPAKRRGSKRAQ